MDLLSQSSGSFLDTPHFKAGSHKEKSFVFLLETVMIWTDSDIQPGSSCRTLTYMTLLKPFQTTGGYLWGRKHDNKSSVSLWADWQAAVQPPCLTALFRGFCKLPSSLFLKLNVWSAGCWGPIGESNAWRKKETWRVRESLWWWGCRRGQDQHYWEFITEPQSKTKLEKHGKEGGYETKEEERVWNTRPDR